MVSGTRRVGTRRRPVRKMTRDMKSSIEQKYKKGNQILFSRDSECLQELIRLIEMQKHRTLVMWAFDCVRAPIEMLKERYPDEARPGRALELAEAWARGNVKMPEARRAILDAHAAAKEMEDRADIALAHAVGHACATVHVETHALGLVFYELTAVVLRAGLESYESAVEEKLRYYYDRLLYWQENIDKIQVSWAKFLLDDARPNKEKVLNEKRRPGKRSSRQE